MGQMPMSGPHVAHSFSGHLDLHKAWRATLAHCRMGFQPVPMMASLPMMSGVALAAAAVRLDSYLYQNSYENERMACGPLVDFKSCQGKLLAINAIPAVSCRFSWELWRLRFCPQAKAKEEAEAKAQKEEEEARSTAYLP